MTLQDRHRLETFSQVKSGHLDLRKAGELCYLSYRQARRVWQRYKELGDAGLLHLARGRPGNGTLQDRLVKGLRVKRISSIDKANSYLAATFLPELNEKFRKSARDSADVHRRWPVELKREEVLCVQEERMVGRDWCVVFEHRVLQLDKGHQSLGLAGRRVMVLQSAAPRVARTLWHPERTVLMQ